MQIFISTPISSYKNAEEFKEYKEKVISLLTILRKDHIVYSEIEDINEKDEFDHPNESITKDLDLIKKSDCFIMHYPNEMPTSALIELGYALANNKKVVIITPSVITLPHLAQGITVINSSSEIIERKTINSETIDLIQKKVNKIALETNEMYFADYYPLRNKVGKVGFWLRFTEIWFVYTLLTVFIISGFVAVGCLFLNLSEIKEVFLKHFDKFSVLCTWKPILIASFFLIISIVALIVITKSNWYSKKLKKFEIFRWTSIEDKIHESFGKNTINEDSLEFLLSNFKDEVKTLTSRTERNYAIILLSSLITAISGLLGNLIDAIINYGEQDYTLNSAAIISAVVVIIAIILIEWRNDAWKTISGQFALDNYRIACFTLEEKIKECKQNNLEEQTKINQSDTKPKQQNTKPNQQKRKSPKRNCPGRRK